MGRQLILFEIERCSDPDYHFKNGDGTRLRPLTTVLQLPVQQRKRAIHDMNDGLSPLRTQAITDVIFKCVQCGIRNPTAVGVMRTHVTHVVAMYLQRPDILCVGCDGDTGAFKALTSQWCQVQAKQSPDAAAQLLEPFALAIAELLVYYVVYTVGLPGLGGPELQGDSPHSNRYTAHADQTANLGA